jgi:formylglycine-generating enzyme required for sulfatase activity
VADWYGREYYADSPRLNPAGPDNGIRRVTRGGAWPNNIHADRIRATYRNPLNPDYINASLGFRCAQSP